MIDSTDLCIRYDNFLEIAEDHLVPTKSGYYDNFLTDEKKLSWGREPYSNLFRGTKWPSVGSERQYQRMVQLSPSTTSRAEGSQVANGTLMPLEWTLYVVWTDEPWPQFFHCSLERTIQCHLPVHWQVKIIWKKRDLSKLWDLLKTIALSAQSIHKSL